MTVFVAVLIGIAYYAITSKVDEIKAKWPAIEFAMEEPDVVLATKERFASDSAEMKAKYKAREATPQDKLIEQVTEKLEVSKQ